CALRRPRSRRRRPGSARALASAEADQSARASGGRALRGSSGRGQILRRVRSARPDTFNDTQLQARHIVDEEALGFEVIERIAQQVIGVALHQRVDYALAAPYPRDRAADVLE